MMVPQATTKLIRALHGIGAITYGGMGVGGISVWPMSIMMFDDPKWKERHKFSSILHPMLWLGVIGFGPICLFSSYELGVAARYGYYASRSDILLPISYSAVWSCIAGLNEMT